MKVKYSSGSSRLLLPDIGTRRVFKCDRCKQRQVKVAHREYVMIGDDVKTKSTEDKS